LSERNTADTNHALAYLMKSAGAFPKGVDIKKVLEFYFQNCSLQCNTDAMSIIAATLANGGVCPLTNERVLQTKTVKDVLSIMNSCGMYDYSGEFAFRVGLPAKSGVSGAIMIIVPGVMGICTLSPKLDIYGNSSKGVQFCQSISEKYALHYF
jgi:glutaminase